MNTLKKIAIALVLIAATTAQSFSVQQPLVPWNGAGSYTICFGNATVGYYYYQISYARTDEELQCYANECYADYLVKIR